MKQTTNAALSVKWKQIKNYWWLRLINSSGSVLLIIYLRLSLPCDTESATKNESKIEYARELKNDMKSCHRYVLIVTHPDYISVLAAPSPSQSAHCNKLYFFCAEKASDHNPLHNHCWSDSQNCHLGEWK